MAKESCLIKKCIIFALCIKKPLGCSNILILDALFYFYYQLHSGIPALTPIYGDFDMTSYPTSPPI